MSQNEAQSNHTDAAGLQPILASKSVGALLACNVNHDQSALLHWVILGQVLFRCRQGWLAWAVSGSATFLGYVPLREAPGQPDFDDSDFQSIMDQLDLGAPSMLDDHASMRSLSVVADLQVSMAGAWKALQPLQPLHERHDPQQTMHAVIGAVLAHMWHALVH